MIKTDRLEIRITPEEAAWLDALALPAGHTRSSYVRLLIRQNYEEGLITPAEIGANEFEAQKARYRRVYTDAMEWLYKRAEAGDENALRMIVTTGHDGAVEMGLTPKEDNEVTP